MGVQLVHVFTLRLRGKWRGRSLRRRHSVWDTMYPRMTRRGGVDQILSNPDLRVQLPPNNTTTLLLNTINHLTFSHATLLIHHAVLHASMRSGFPASFLVRQQLPGSFVGRCTPPVLPILQGGRGVLQRPFFNQLLPLVRLRRGSKRGLDDLHEQIYLHVVGVFLDNQLNTYRAVRIVAI